MQLTEDARHEVEGLHSNFVETFIARLAEQLGAAARATTIFAELIERDGVTVIPVAKARWGFGGGGGRKGEEVVGAVGAARRSARSGSLN